MCSLYIWVSILKLIHKSILTSTNKCSYIFIDPIQQRPAVVNLTHIFAFFKAFFYSCTFLSSFDIYHEGYFIFMLIIDSSMFNLNLRFAWVLANNNCVFEIWSLSLNSGDGTGDCIVVSKIKQVIFILKQTIKKL